jgi:hypothetical protein
MLESIVGRDQLAPRYAMLENPDGRPRSQRAAVEHGMRTESRGTRGTPPSDHDCARSSSEASKNPADPVLVLETCFAAPVAR